MKTFSLGVFFAVGLALFAIYGHYHIEDRKIPTNDKLDYEIASTTASIKSLQQESSAKQNAISEASPPTLRSRFKILADSKNPRKVMDAYNILMACNWAIQAERTAELEAPGIRSDETKKAMVSGQLRNERETACQDLTVSDVDSRLRLAEFAAEAGVPLAAIRLTAEGPWGDTTALASRPDDIAVKQWRSQMYKLTQKAAFAGDAAAMQSLSRMNATGVGLVDSVDRIAALRWNAAMWEVRSREGNSSYIGGEGFNTALARGLSPSQAASAIAEGRHIAKTALSISGS